MKNNFEEFKSYDFNENYIDFLNEFVSVSDEEYNSFLLYFFLPLDDNDYSYYNKLKELFCIYQKNNFKTEKNELSKKIKEFGIDTFMTVSINKLISKLGSKYYRINNCEYSIFSSYIKYLFDNNNTYNIF